MCLAASSLVSPGTDVPSCCALGTAGALSLTSETKERTDHEQKTPFPLALNYRSRSAVYCFSWRKRRSDAESEPEPDAEQEQAPATDDEGTAYSAQ